MACPNGVVDLRRPFTGAWIETIHCTVTRLGLRRRPFTGAWIETTRRFPTAGGARSPLHGGVD